MRAKILIGMVVVAVSSILVGSFAFAQTVDILLGDINRDGIVEESDYGILSMSWYKSPGEDGYDLRADLNHDGLVDMDDFIILERNWYNELPESYVAPTPKSPKVQAAQADTIIILGDINHDGSVDMADFTILESHWYTEAGDENYNPDADINGDGIIEESDFGILSTNWGRTSNSGQQDSAALEPPVVTVHCELDPDAVVSELPAELVQRKTIESQVQAQAGDRRFVSEMADQKESLALEKK